MAHHAWRSRARLSIPHEHLTGSPFHPPLLSPRRTTPGALPFWRSPPCRRPRPNAFESACCVIHLALVPSQDACSPRTPSRSTASSTGRPYCATVNARAIRLTELKPFRPSVRNFLRQNRGHPALLAVYADLDRILHEATLTPVRHRPRAQDWQQRMRYDLALLHQGGVTGQEVYELVATLFMFAEYNPRTLQPWSRPFWFSAARLTLNLRSRDRDCPLNNKHAASRVNSKTLETIGKRITITCAVVFRAMKETIEASVGFQQKQRQVIERLLVDEPFKIPT
jgi:hypothetical protein